ncbi:gliding motility-associated-like protein [Aquimarina sp. MAR_2010_214]|uniref:T9SS type B sorting domain-containing protein n=1 Tax=Aquimarina sp. MAR_2010_214 TaxID=1250026 RepID=UPI000C7090EB|nr:choice-of-anchor L domain-containing protein [Aquimarina sp. MAR_2010_214]PKV51786.1 gliding motility-associated-like protein [Aquimarina sp. MAR_2010_214]
MSKIKKVVQELVVFFFLIFAFLGNAQITVDDHSFTVAQLVEDVLVDSPCATVENFSSFTGTNFGINGIGYFESNNSGFEIDRGVILSTGYARSAVGPNGITALSEGDSSGWGGDADLGLVTNTANLFNASYIQFEFVPTIDFISFDFLFASEEYTAGFPCTFSDVFAFILTDSSGNSRNLAVVPGTNIPIKVTTVNEGVDLNYDGDYDDTINQVSECIPKNPNFYNRTIPPGSLAPINFNGYTKVLKASGSVVVGERYTIKLVIAENQDGKYDSAVFLAAGSFDIGGNLGDDRTIAKGNPGCLGESIILTATIGSGSIYVWMKGGIPLAPGDGTTLLAGGEQLEVTQDGTYSVDIDVSGLCTSSDSVDIEFAIPPVIAASPDDLKSCDPESDGIASFDFSNNTLLVLGSQNPSVYKVSYHLNKDDAENYKGSIRENVIATPNDYKNISSPQTIWLRIAESTQTCYTTVPFTITALPIAPITLEEEYTRCLDQEGTLINILPNDIELELDTTQYAFQWYAGLQAVMGNEIPGEINASFTPQVSGDYSIEITNLANGCSISKGIKIVDSYPPEEIKAELISGAFSNSGRYEVTVTGNGQYEYKIDNGDWQESNFFDGVTKAEHTITVRDIKMCGELSTKVELTSGYPEYFTPNRDGFHDSWRIEETKNVSISEVLIFDRYGKLLKDLGVNDNWDGTYRGSQLPASDYWFKVHYIENGVPKVFNSNFSLIR